MPEKKKSRKKTKKKAKTKAADLLGKGLAGRKSLDDLKVLEKELDEYKKSVLELTKSIIAKYIGRTQYIIDPDFRDEYSDLREKLYSGKISSKKFLKSYKSILLESLARNKEIAEDILKEL